MLPSRYELESTLEVATIFAVLLFTAVFETISCVLVTACIFLEGISQKACRIHAKSGDISSGVLRRSLQKMQVLSYPC
jgi:hypothetical protein